LTVFAEDARDCISVSKTKATYSKESTVYVFTNNCELPVTVHWCHRKSGDEYIKGFCGDKKFFRKQRKIKAGESYSNAYGMPGSSSLEYGACFGSAGKLVPSSTKEYLCKTDQNLVNEVLACRENPEACDLSSKYSHGDKVEMAVACGEGPQLVKLSSPAPGVFYVKSSSGRVSSMNTRNSKSIDLESFCEQSPEDTGVVGVTAKFLMEKVKQVDKYIKLTEYEECLKQGREVLVCDENLNPIPKLREAVSGKRG